MSEYQAFARLIEALRPWLGELVVAGGWAHRLYRFHGLAHRASYLPIQTKDADLVFSPAARLGDDLGPALRAAGFTQDLLGDHTPPVVHYRLSGEDEAFYAEFLTTLRGDGLARRRRKDATLARAGVIAQKLRYIDLLLIQPWIVRLGPTVGVPTSTDLDVRIPNAVSFIVQKLLIHGRRAPEKQAQDVLYIHDTLDLFGAELETLNLIWLEHVRPSLPKRTARRVERLQHEQFTAITDAIRNAARIPQDRTLTADRVQAACSYGLGEMFRSR